MTNDEVKVEPCPLCSSGCVGITAVRDGYEVWCRCGLSMTKHNPNSRAKAIEAWNTRAARPAPAEDAVERVALDWLAAEETAEELLRCRRVDWGSLSPEERIAEIGKRKDARDAAILAARAALAAMQPRGEQQEWPEDAAFPNGALVQKKGRASWRGKIVGWYRTDITALGYAVESTFEPGSVQIYPETALLAWDGEQQAGRDG